MAATSRFRPRTIAGAIVAAATIIGAVSIALGFFGSSVEAFDSVGHFRAHLSVVVLVLALLSLAIRRPMAAVIGLVAAGVGLVTTLPFLLPPSGTAEPSAGTPVYSMLQMNLRFNAPDRSPALRVIADTRPDVVTLQEVTDDWRGAFEALKAVYPYQAFCGSYGVGGSGILSRRPFLPSSGLDVCEPKDGLVARSVDFNGQAVTLAALHLEWPWPHKHWQQIARLRSILPDLSKPVLLGGDFNAVPWSAAVTTLAGAGGLSVMRGIGPSWMNYDFPALPARWFGLPIDNVLASPEIAVLSIGTLAPTQSDHLPVLVRFTVARPAAPPPVAVVSR